MLINIFTDGSCKNNGKKNSVGGIGIYFDNDEICIFFNDLDSLKK